ncbi:hypothetical protein BDV29DRAFT_187370 [Aspergillus leporis]|uniref:Fructose-bisphosphate aldolase n=1 Tax=Aspergillus leporis TaxID=41062 RepID=A0A5N5XGA9_9EURO|nr:hypothetical protein BDV29DRAFT_187370 [Aspergillus leporis]
MSWRGTNKTLQILEAAEQGRYGVLAAITPSLVHAAAAAAKIASVPISIHLDHAQNFDQIRHIADTLPFDSIMSISVEAETGRIEGGEDGIMGTRDLEGILTSPEDVEDFIRAGVDYLAPSVGNLHGDYGPKGPNLDMDRLRGIFKALNGRVHLLSKACIQAGVTKFNVNKLVLDPWNDYIKTNIHKPITQVIEEGIEVTTRWMERWMDIMGSTGKA